VRTERYLVFTLTADMLSVIPLSLWMARPEDLYLPLPSLLLPPLIHAAHGQGKKAAGSLFMRIAMVGGVYLAGRSAEAECAEAELVCLPFGSIMLANLAIVPVVVLDSLLLAQRSVEVPGWSRLPITPSISTGPNGRVSLALGTQF
jgi:hypothetical protein